MTGMRPSAAMPGTPSWQRVTVRLALCAAAGLACALVIAPPLLRAAGWPIAAGAVRLLFMAACHQIPERTFHVLGAPLAVCARCFGCYAGFFAGCLAFWGIRAGSAPRARWLAVAAAPGVLQWLVARGGGPDDPGLRYVTGTCFGLITAFYIVPAFDALCGEIRSHRWRRLFLGELHAKTR